MHVYYKNIIRNPDSFDSVSGSRQFSLAATSALEVILLYKSTFYLLTY